MKSILLFIMSFMVSTQIFAQNFQPKQDRIYGQMYYGKLSTNAFFKKADYIFEATRVSGSRKSFTNKDTSEVWTSYLFEITHVFKGGDKIHSGIIEIVRDCGVIRAADNSRVIFDYKTDQCLNFNTEKMVLFCKKSPDSYRKTDNAFAVQPLENLPRAAFYYRDGSPNVSFRVYGLDHVYFKTVEDFYRYAGKKKGITVPVQEADKKKAALRVGSAYEFSNPKLDKFMARQQPSHNHRFDPNTPLFCPKS